MNRRLKKIGRALKIALLSLFHMDYQIEDLSTLKVSTLKLAFILLTITTILWVMVFYTFREYLFVGIALSAGWLGFIVVAMHGLSQS